MKKLLLSIAMVLLAGGTVLVQAESCPTVVAARTQVLPKQNVKTVVITIDGPDASGKSTIAKMVADKLGYQNLNSGYLYRAISYILTNKLGYTQAKLNNLQASDVKSILDSNRLKFNINNGSHDVVYDNVSITPLLRSSEVNEVVHNLGKNQAVRQALADYLQQRIKDIKRPGVVAESYGIGKTFPGADLKIYLTATPEVRALRLKEERGLLGQQLTIEEARAKLRDHDNRGDGKDITTREIPADAKVIDTTSLTKQQVVDAVIALINKK